MRPRRARSMSGRTAEAVAKEAVRLTAIVSDHTDSRVRMARASWLTPAHATRTSIGPCSVRARDTARRRAA